MSIESVFKIISRAYVIFICRFLSNGVDIVHFLAPRFLISCITLY